ncbi:MAG: hypothetical protein JRN14_03370 [Nitrososphaerota archaeon]|nr:hypothetical protein [Nitrososphaerota archaeon]
MSVGHLQGGNEQEELTIPEISAKYKDRWVAIVVTARDSNSQPTKGKIVAQDVDRYRLRSGLVKYEEVCIFYTGETPYPLLL